MSFAMFPVSKGDRMEKMETSIVITGGMRSGKTTVL